MKYKFNKTFRKLFLICMCVAFFCATNATTKPMRTFKEETIISLMNVYNNFNCVRKINAKNEKFTAYFSQKKLDLLNEIYEILKKKYKELTKNEYINTSEETNKENNQNIAVFPDDITNIAIRTASNIYDSFLLIYGLYSLDDAKEDNVELPNLKKAYMIAKKIVNNKHLNDKKKDDSNDNDENEEEENEDEDEN